MTRNGNLTVGVVLIAVGVGATLISVGGTGTGYVYWGLVVVGLWRVILGVRVPDQVPGHVSFEEMLDREGPSRGPQVVGATCVRCQQKVFADAPRAECAICEEVVHLDCMKSHRKAEHPTGKRKPPAA